MPASQFQQGILVFDCLPPKKHSQQFRSCPHLDSTKVAKQFQQISNQTSKLTNRHIKQSKKECKKKNEIEKMGKTPC
jgi:hypothetical protein